MSTRLRGGTPNKWAVLIALFYLQAITTMVNIGVIVASTTIADVQGYDWQTIAYLLGALNLGLTLGLMPFGRMSDRFSEKTALLTGFIGATLCLMVSIVLASHPYLILSLVLTGFFLASSISCGAAVLYRTFPTHQRGLAFGLRMTGGPVGGVLASLAVPALLTSSIELVFIAFTAATALGIVLIQLLIPRGRRDLGAISEARAAPARVQGIGSNRVPWFKALQLPLIMAFISGLAQTSNVLTGSLAPQLLDNALSLTLAEVGYFMAISQVGGGVGRTVFGSVSDRVRRHSTVAIGLMFVLVAALVLLSFLPYSVAVTYLIVFTLLSILTQSVNPILITLTTEVSDPRLIGVSVGVQQTAIGIVATTGPLIIGMVVASYGWRSAMPVLAICSLIALLVLIRLRRARDLKKRQSR